MQRWIDAYVDAWRTYDPAAIGALFAEDATYAYHPYDEEEQVVRGREAIVADWLEERDDPGSWEASYRPLVVEGTTSYTNGDYFWNLWTLRFDEENRCAEFVEWFMVRPRVYSLLKKADERPTRRPSSTPRHFFLLSICPSAWKALSPKSAWTGASVMWNRNAVAMIGVRRRRVGRKSVC